MLAMRVHRTMCSGHRPPSSPRPMAAPAAPHRPARARTPRLRAAPCGPARSSGAARCGAAEGGGGRGAGGPAAEGSCAGGRPGRRVRARSVVGPGARVTHDFARAPRGKQETPRQQLGRTSRRPEPAPRLGSRCSPSLAAANHVPGTGPSGALANFQRPRAFPLRRLTTEHSVHTFQKVTERRECLRSSKHPHQHPPLPHNPLRAVPKCFRAGFQTPSGDPRVDAEI